MIYSKYNEPAAFVTSANCYWDSSNPNYNPQPCICLKVAKDFIANPGNNPIFAARAEVWKQSGGGDPEDPTVRGERLGIKGSIGSHTHGTGGGNGGPKDWCIQTTTTDGSLSLNGFDGLLSWVNWPEVFGHSDWTIPDFMNGEKGGGFNEGYTCHRIDECQKQYIWNTKGSFYDESDKDHDPNSLVASGKNFHLTKWENGFPAYMGGQIIFETDESFPNSNKWLHIGFKGCSYYDGSAGTVDHKRDSYRSYKFDTGHFKSLGNKKYLFFDDKIIPYIKYDSNSNVNEYKFEFVGPMFYKVWGSTYKIDSDNNKVYTGELKDTEFVNTKLLCSVATLNEEDDLENPIIATPKDSVYVSTTPRIYNIWNTSTTEYINVYMNGGVIIGYNPKDGNGHSGNPLSIKSNCKKIKFGKSAKAFGQIYTATDGVKVTCPNCNGTLKEKRYAIKFNARGTYFYVIFGLPDEKTSGPHEWTKTSDYSRIENFDRVSESSLFDTIKDAQAWANTETGREILGEWIDDYETYIPPNCFHCNKTGKVIDYYTNALEEIEGDWKNCINLNYGDSQFTDCRNLKKIPSTWEGLESLVTAQCMFTRCVSLTTIPSKWSENGKGLINLKQGDSMFYKCTSLQRIESWSGFRKDTTNKLHFYSMFNGCTSLNYIGFDPNSETYNLPDEFVFMLEHYDIASMFEGCTALNGVYDPFKLGAAIYPHLSSNTSWDSIFADIWTGDTLNQLKEQYPNLFT